MKKKVTTKAYTEMNTEELAEATKEFNQEFILDTFRPPTRAERTILRRAKARKPGRPVQGKGAVRVLVTIEQGLLQEADAYAERAGLKRAQLVALGLRAVMSGKAKKRSA